MTFLSDGLRTMFENEETGLSDDDSSRLQQLYPNHLFILQDISRCLTSSAIPLENGFNDIARQITKILMMYSGKGWMN